MKTFYLFLIFGFANIFTGVSQDYEPIIKNGSFWDIETTLGGSCSFSKTRYQIGDDIILNGKTYKKLLVAEYSQTADSYQPCPIYVNPLSVDSNDFTEHNQYIREDVSEKKVYIYTEVNNGSTGYEEYVLYDFNLEVGDITGNDFIIPGLEISSIEYDSDGRKKYSFANSPRTYTEGIGSSGGIINLESIIGEGYRELFCWGNTQNMNGCAPTLSTENYQLSQIKMFPNPTKDKISLTNLDNNTLKLYSILGKEISFQFSQESQEIDITHLQQGVYFLEIRGTQNSKRVIKVVKN